MLNFTKRFIVHSIFSVIFMPDNKKVKFTKAKHLLSLLKQPVKTLKGHGQKIKDLGIISGTTN